MENVPRNLYTTLKRSWTRRSYDRLEGGRKSSRKTVRIARLGGEKLGFWRVKAIPKLRRLRVITQSSPLKLLSKLKNSYMNMMLNLAGNVGELNNDVVFGEKRIPKARLVKSPSSSSSQTEAKLIWEIYKSLIASSEFKT